MRRTNLILAFLALILMVGAIYAANKPKVGYLDKWGVPTEKQEALLKSGVWLAVDTLNSEVSVQGIAPWPECPFWCPCGPKGKCWEWGNECYTCAAPPSPGITGFVNDVVDTLIARNQLEVLVKKKK